MTTEASDNVVNSRRVKIIMTITCYASFSIFGCMTYMIGPSRFDIMEQVHSNLEDISYGPMARAAGEAIAAVTTGLILTKVSRQRGDLMFILTAGLVQLAVPFAQTLFQYLMSELAWGITSGIHNTNKNSWILEMWQSGANPFLQALHAVFAIGSTIAPVIIAPYLSDSNSTIAYERESHIIVPYSILSGLVIGLAFVFAFLYHKVPYIDEHRQVGKSSDSGDEAEDVSVQGTDESSLETEEGKASRPAHFNLILILLSCVCIGSYVGIELGSLGFSATFAVYLPLDFTKVDAAHIASATSASFAANRLFSIFLATRFSAKSMLIGSFVLLSTGNILLLIFATSSRTMVWIAFLILGSGHSNVYPSFLSFLEQKINVTTKVVGFFLVASCTAAFIIPALFGQFMKPMPLIYVYVNLTCLTVCAVTFVLILGLDEIVRRINDRRRMY